MIWRGRHHAAAAFLSVGPDGRQPPIGMRMLARAWAGLIAAYTVVLFAVTIAAALAEAPVNALSFLGALLIVTIGLPVVDGLIGLVLSRHARAGAEAEATSFRQTPRVLRRAARIVVAVVAALIVLDLLGVNLVTAANQTLGGWAVRLVFNIGMTVLVAYVLWELAIAAINRKLAEDAAAHGAGASHEVLITTRLSTLLPLFRRVLQVAIFVIAGLMVLSSLGVDIGPMLAGAGIVGLAVGFGAQTLVKDLISGLFFLLDDAFRVTEYIEAGGVGGSVERINTRSLSLRTPAGAIHTVPFGSIDAVANYSRDWAIVKMEFKVTYDTDLGKVKRIFRRIGDELMQDAELAPGFIQPFKFQGVKAMEETGIIVRGKFMAVPGTQFQIRKQVFERVQKAFAEEGIDFAQRRVQVDLPPGLELDESAKEAVSRAAAAAALASEPPATPGKGGP
jgi:small-conductance mechanosensitive channel